MTKDEQAEELKNIVEYLHMQSAINIIGQGLLDYCKDYIDELVFAHDVENADELYSFMLDLNRDGIIQITDNYILDQDIKNFVENGVDGKEDE